jgi:parallel beta-helix repeat protein
VELASVSAAAYVIAPGSEAQTELQEALIMAEPGDVVQLEEGTFDLELGLSLDVDNVTLRGRGMDKTVLDFKGQVAGAEGLHVTSDNVLLEDFAIVDTKGNGVKSHSANNIIYRRVRAEWTGGPKPENGAYGLYPVSSSNVLIEECVAIGGSDSGIYVGQSQNVLVRNCRAEYNVAGIEIENCHGADVINCVATKNTGGILVFDLPDLPQQNGHDVRLLDNKVFDNNTPNFAPPGNIVGTVLAGTGIIVMANTNVEIFDNDIRDHGTTNITVASYFGTGNKIKDPSYYPYPEKVHIHHNTFGPCGGNPDGETGGLLALGFGKPLPDVIWDGVFDPSKLVDGVLPEESRIYIGEGNVKEGGELAFGNAGGMDAIEDPLNAKPSRDISNNLGSFPPIPPVVIEGA